MECCGVCPKCGSMKLSYGPIDVDGNQIFYDFVCDDCGCEGTEWYDIVYVETTVKGDSV